MARPQPILLSCPSVARKQQQQVLVRHHHHVSRKKHNGGTFALLSCWMLRNQIRLAASLTSLLFLAHLVPGAQPHTSKFFTLSYRNSSNGKYSSGWDDVYLVVCLITLFTGLRASVMKYLLSPFARSRGVSKAKDLARFTEQAWLMCYYAVFWTMGMRIYTRSAYFLDMAQLWVGWPDDRELTGLVKFYILAQLSFWLQQLIVVNIEERRKDYLQMLCHHFVTIGLIYGCYAYHLTRVGNLILVIMDFVDIILPLAKCLKYLRFHKTVCDVVFGIFLLSWIITRHIFYTMACWSVYSDTDAIIGRVCFRGSTGENLQGPFAIPEAGNNSLLEPFLDPQGLICWTKAAKWWFLTPLLSLQVMNFIWLYMIVRVALRVIRKEGAEDSRSDEDNDADFGSKHEEANLGSDYLRKPLPVIFEDRPHLGS